MQKPTSINYYFEWSRQFPHIAAVDLLGNNVAIEVAVMAISPQNGDLFFIRLDHLDNIELKRLKQILMKRDSARYALWDLMSQTTLLNGMNALEFFQQFVKLRTASGKILSPNSGQRGLPLGELGYKGPAANGYSDGKTEAVAQTKPEVNADEDVEVVDDQPAPKKKAGRPKKATKAA